jgi:hypothetical protein
VAAAEQPVSRRLKCAPVQMERAKSHRSCRSSTGRMCSLFHTKDRLSSRYLQVSDSQPGRPTRTPESSVGRVDQFRGEKATTHHSLARPDGCGDEVSPSAPYLPSGKPLAKPKNICRAGRSEVLLLPAAGLGLDCPQKAYSTALPQLGQNFDPAGTSVLQLPQIMDCPILAPQWLQNLAAPGMGLPQLGQGTVAAAPPAAAAPPCMA